MSSHTNHWWRAHHGISNDAKLQFLATRSGVKRCEIGWVWIIMVDFASQNEPRGSILGLSQAEIAFMAEIPEGAVSSIIEAMKERGMIQPDGMLSSWSKRQPQRDRENGDPTAAERQRRRRLKLKLAGQAADEDAPERHGDVTLLSRDVTVPSRDVTDVTKCHGDAMLQPAENEIVNNSPVTPCHAQRRGEESRGEDKTTTLCISPPKNGGAAVSLVKRPQQSWYSSSFEEWYMIEYWCHKSRSTGRKAYERAINRQVDKRHMGYNQAKLFLVEMARSDRVRFEHTEDWVWRTKLLPATWLNEERWTDEAPQDASAPRKDAPPPKPIKTVPYDPMALWKAQKLAEQEEEKLEVKIQ